MVSSASDVRHHRPGDVIDVSGDAYQELPPIAAVLEGEGDGGETRVRLLSALTEVGTLEMSCLSEGGSPSGGERERRWKLEFQLRGASKTGSTAQRVTQLHPRFGEATDRVRLVYGKSSQEIAPRMIKSLRTDLEKIIGSRAEWDTPLLRELFGALWAGAKRRRRSAAHERVWFNLVGYSLRPGFGYPLDEWRVDQLWSIFKGQVQFQPETQNWAEWWHLWRRVVGGLDASKQEQLLDAIEWYLHPPTKRPRKRPPGPKMLGYDDMVRLAGSLEHVSNERKRKVGDWLVTRLMSHGENSQTWWAVGRLGARVPFHGSAHNVADRAVAEAWLGQCLRVDWASTEHAAFAATLLSRMSGDRERDVGQELRSQVLKRLETTSAPPSWHHMVAEVAHLDQADERRIFGESLPPGLRLVD